MTETCCVKPCKNKTNAKTKQQKKQLQDKHTSAVFVKSNLHPAELRVLLVRDRQDLLYLTNIELSGTSNWDQH